MTLPIGMTGVHHIPGYGMAYDPSKIRIEGDKIFVNQDGNWTELVGLNQQQPSQYGSGAMSAGTLGASPSSQWPAMQQMAMRNPLPEIMGIVNRLSPQQARRPVAPAYQNPYISSLLRYL